MAYTKPGSPLLYDEATNDVVGIKDSDGSERLFLTGAQVAGITSSVVGADGSPPAATLVGTSRALTAADNGLTLECTATVTLTVPAGLAAGFGCAVIPSGTTSIASSGGALLNGATSTITRTAASNAMFAIQARASAANSYVVTGA